jgi:hypothetical protein
MNTLLRITGVSKLISFYRHIYFNQPRLVTFTGISLILMIGFTHMYVFPEHFKTAPYLGLSFAVLFVLSVISAINILRGSLRWGWALGAVISGVALLSYILSRTLGFPGFPEAQNNWATPAGTVTMAFEAMFVLTYISLITGMNVAWPWKREWHD